MPSFIATTFARITQEDSSPLRRFVASLPGKVVCHTVVTALILPFLTLLSVSRAEAQIQTLPSWAVVDFVNRSNKGGDQIGVLAADSVANELAKTGKYDVTPREQVARAIQALNLVTPVTESTSLFRLATEVQATALVTGEVVNYMIRPVANGKQAEVIVRAIVRDVASGLPVNGGAQSAQSSVRPGDTPDEVLLQEAFSLAATKLVTEISNRTIARATVLNTFEETAFVNQGSRAGFKPNQELIVFRGNEQVATARVVSVAYDSSEIRIVRSIRGMKPGDKVQVIFEVPQIESSFGGEGTRAPRTRTRAGKRNNNEFLQLIGAVAILAFVMGSKGSGGQQVVERVRAEAQLDNFSAGPSVRISWGTNVFVRGNEQKFQFQIWRSDVTTAPVLVAPGTASSAVDTSQNRTVVWFSAPRSSVTVCTGAPTAEEDFGAPGVNPGQPYLYQVELIYRISSLDFPTPPPPGGSGFCYFQSDRRSSSGPATPLNRPELLNPAEAREIANDEELPFTFQSVVSAAPINVQYILQFSTTSAFSKGQTETIGPIISNSSSVVSMGTINTFEGRSSAIRNATTVYWRIGARNVEDRPGPVPDASGQRYIFSIPRTFTRPDNPPPPPGGGGGNPPLG